MPEAMIRRSSRDPAPLLVPRALAAQLMRLYDFPDPRKPGRVIRGYDRHHARRTARMCAAVARRLGHPASRVRNYQIACLLHDLGRAGLDQKLFGMVWSWARKNGIPTRPREWRAVHPDTPYNRETEAFLDRYAGDLARLGIPLDTWTRQQVEMRLGYARRLSRHLRAAQPGLREMGVKWAPWMGRIMMYYYYPEKLNGSPRWVRELAEVLVACEQFEAYSNRRRGQDYYRRAKEKLSDAFAYLDKLRVEGILSPRVVAAVRDLAAQGAFDKVLAEARGAALPKSEIRYLRGLKTA
ncbi:MAG: hypothetical protein D4R81_05680 [Nitrospiraceae bacterium]|nr:MAG: hypothetical protein D4R81_05680 [Nitrospiraceae bacterium]